MAQAMGIGVVPWSPLRSGKLTGKYTRDGYDDPASRAAMFGQPAEHEWPVIDAVAALATEVGVTSAEVALAWVIGRPGIGSTLIGARTVEQLHANLASLQVTLTPEQRATLDEVSTPTLDFPTPALLDMSAGVAFGGMSIDGTSYPSLTISGRPRQGEYRPTLRPIVGRRIVGRRIVGSWRSGSGRSRPHPSLCAPRRRVHRVAEVVNGTVERGLVIGAVPRVRAMHGTALTAH